MRHNGGSDLAINVITPTLVTLSTGRKRGASSPPPAGTLHKAGKLSVAPPFVPSPLPNLRGRLNSTPANVRKLKLLFEFCPMNLAPSPVAHVSHLPNPAFSGHLHQSSDCIESLVFEADLLLHNVPSSPSMLPSVTRFEEVFPNYDGACDILPDDAAVD